MRYRYYLGDLLEMIGKTNSIFKQKLNVGLSCWGLVCAFTAAMLVTRFRRRVMYLTCTISLLICYICWTVTMQQSLEAIDAGGKNNAAAAATIFFIFAYSPCYNLGYNALTYTYMVEIWPYALRSRGIAWFQLFGRLANFFTTFVNPIGLDDIGWKWLIVYCCWLAFEICFVWFMFPETFGRTLEELTFSTFSFLTLLIPKYSLTFLAVFEDKALADKAVVAVEKVIHHEDMSIVPSNDKIGTTTQSERVEGGLNAPPKV